MGDLGDLLQQTVHDKPKERRPKGQPDFNIDHAIHKGRAEQATTRAHAFSAPAAAPAPRTFSTPRASSALPRSGTLQSYTGSTSHTPVHTEQAPADDHLAQRLLLGLDVRTGAVTGDATGAEQTGTPEQKLAQDKPHTEPENYGRPSTRRLSREEFGRLSPEEQAAIRFNTLLVDAREKDLNNRGKYTPDNAQQAEYDKTVKHMFGAHGGSATFAPETVAVLKQLDFDKVGDDLDDYLGLKNAVTEQDLATLKQREAARPLITSMFEAQRHDGGEVARGQQTERFAEKSSQLREAMARAHHLMTSFSGSAALGRNDEVLRLGGEVNKVHPEFGYGENSDRRKAYQDVDAFLHNTFATLGQRSGEHAGETWGLINQADLALPKLNVNDVYMRYADTQTQLAREFNLPLGKAGGYRTPQEYREYLGLGKQKGDI